MDIHRFRIETPGTTHRIHLNNAGASLMTTPVINKIKEIIDQETREGGYEVMFAREGEIRQAYDSLGHLMHSKSRNIAFSASATDAWSIAVSSVPLSRGDVILTTTNDYCANQITFLAMIKRLGVRVLHVPDTAAGGVSVDAFEEYVKKYRPKLAAVTHVPTNSGLVQPVGEIGKICRENELLYLVDGCQSVGQMDVNPDAIGCDFFSATSRKFLRGPRGMGFLWVSDRALDMGLEPMYMDLNGAEWTDAETYIPRSDAKRYETFEFSYALLLAMAEAARYAINIGLPAIETRVNALAAYTRDRLSEIPGVRVLDEGEKLCGIVTFHIEGEDPMAVKNRLDKRGINCSLAFRRNAVMDFDRKGVNWALRFSPHYYNTEAEIEEVLGVKL
ncbi:MAG: aminotransferase class V-fold PLP-dependent enzyme [Bacteroidia bacterium]|nr:aminotransferase class V-fold PLP-dependent enzyme [Bacteroidia bacterium]